MATKKRERTHHRRARVGAMSLNPKNPLILIASVGLGFMGADKIYSAIDEAIPTKTTPATATTPAVVSNAISDTVLGGGFAAAGGLLALKGRRTLPKTIAGGVMIGAGLKWALKDQGVLTGGMYGYQSVPVIGRRLGGYQSVPVVGKIGRLGGVPNILNGHTTSRMPALSGVPNILNGYTTSPMPALSGIHF